MPYATEQDMIDRYGADAVIVAADRDGDGESDAGVTSTTLDDASALMDTYLAVRYTVPLQTVPKTMVRFCVDIAMYQMSADCSVATEEQRKRYDDALKFLTALSKGIASLGLETPPPEDPRRGDASFTSAERRFTRDTLRGF